MTTDQERKIHELKEIIGEFCDVRDWGQFHNAKDLAIALSVEASELLEIFQWKDSEEVKALFENEEKREDVADEMADVLYFLVRMSQMCGIDLSEALERKMIKNGEKYPIEKAKGSNKKYNEFD